MTQTTDNVKTRCDRCDISSIIKKIQIKFSKGVKNFSKLIYNRKDGLIFRYSKIELVYLIVFYLIFYGISVVIFAIGFHLINQVGESPTNSIIKKSQTLVPINGHYLDSSKLCIPVATLKQTMHNIINVYSQGTFPSCNSASTTKCSFGASALGQCGSHSGIEALYTNRQYCIYLRLSKITRYKPNGKQNAHLANVNCRQENGLTSIATIPPDLHLAAYPIEFSTDHGPLVALIVPIPTKSSVKYICTTELSDLSPSQSSQLNQAILSTEITLDTTKC